MGGADYTTSAQGEGRCPRCGEGPLKAWYELSEEERGLALKLAGSADYAPAERAARHLFCTRCWHEEVAGSPRLA